MPYHTCDFPLVRRVGSDVNGTVSFPWGDIATDNESCPSLLDDVDINDLS
jgi:hypothetical protein